MATMTRWDPFQDLRSAQDEMAQMSPMLAHALGLHGQQQGSGRATTTAWAPALDISERKDAYLITVELPGVELDDVQITMEGSLLTIQGEGVRPERVAGLEDRGNPGMGLQHLPQPMGEQLELLVPGLEGSRWRRPRRARRQGPGPGVAPCCGRGGRARRGRPPGARPGCAWSAPGRRLGR